MDRDYFDVPAHYCVVAIWDRARLFSAVFGLISLLADSLLYRLSIEPPQIWEALGQARLSRWDNRQLFLKTGLSASISVINSPIVPL
jgi:hypothetical protein